jgi:Right handed beta helix region
MSINAAAKAVTLVPQGDGKLYSAVPGGAEDTITIEVIPIGVGSVSIKWAEIPNLVEYRIYRGPIAGSEELVAKNLPELPFHFDFDLPAGELFYRVSGWNGVTETSSLSIPVTVATSPSPTVIVTDQAGLDAALAGAASGTVIGATFNATAYTVTPAQLQNRDFSPNELWVVTSGGTPARFNSLIVSGATGITFSGLDFYGTSPTCGDIVNISSGSKHIVVDNCEIHADKYAKASTTPGVPNTFDGVEISGATDIVVHRCYFHDVQRGLSIVNSSSCGILGNYITPQSGTAIQYTGGNSLFGIIGNHIFGQDYVPYPTDPDAPADPHASMVSIRSNELLLRGNFFHGMGSSSAIMCYTPDALGGENPYTNIQVEDTVVYDPTNPQSFRIYNLGDNILIRNNLFTGRARTDGTTCPDGYNIDQHYRYQTAVNVQSLGSGVSDYSGLKMYNNIFVGTVYSGLSCVELNNVIWSWAVGTTFQATTPSGTPVLNNTYGCGTNTLAMENTTFFAVAHDYKYPTRVVENWDLAPASSGINAGDVENQSAGSLGSFSGNFIRNDGNLRSPTAHDQGPYQT